MVSPRVSSWQDIRIWGVQDRRSDEKATQPWVVRWAVDGRARGRTFRTRSEAEAFRSELLLAKRLRELFDPETAEPASWSPPPAETKLHNWARRWVGEQWPEWQPRTRASAIEALTRFLPLVTTSRAADPPLGIRGYLTASLRPDATVAGEDPYEQWLDDSMRTLLSLSRDVLARVDSELGRGVEGRQLAPSTASRYRKVARACVRRAVELEVLDRDPWPPTPKGRHHRKAARLRKAVDVRVLPEPATMRRALDAIVTHQPGSRTYRVMTAVAYYGGLRPSEVVMLRPRALQLPAAGWGRIHVAEADTSLDEPGEPKTGERTVPIPPALVQILADWLECHDFAAGELISARGTAAGRVRPTGRGRGIERSVRSITPRCGCTTADTLLPRLG